VLALTGVYGVVSYDVRRRRRELGIRVALGASRARILREVLRSGAVLAAAGVGVGCLAAAALTRVTGSVVVDLGTLDPWVLAAAALLFGAVGVLGSWAPARAAASTDPADALRNG
jgi:putative ABC transport system permease protein